MFFTIQGGTTIPNAARMVRIITTRLAIAEASFQAAFRSPWLRKVVNTGIKAEPRAPPATRLNRISESRLAAKKASKVPLVPMWPRR